MSDTTELTSTDESAVRGRRRTGTGLSGLLLPELRLKAAELGIKGVTRMPKGQLIEAIQQRQGGTGAPGARTGATGAPAAASNGTGAGGAEVTGSNGAESAQPAAEAAPAREERAASRRRATSAQQRIPEQPARKETLAAATVAAQAPD
ncbi:MAG: Rho termination factor N-terminal domain-containing protein, partial [Actinocrinis sp.]